MTRRCLLRLYQALLALYPRSYRLTFSAEMVEVFRQALDDRPALWRLVQLELFDLPRAALKEHLSELGANSRASRGGLWVVSRRELALTLGAFAIPLALIAWSGPGGSLSAALSAALPAALLLIGLVLGAGLLKGLPRWCLPYLGLALSLVTFLVSFTWLADLMLPTVPPWLGPGPHEHSTRLLWQGLLTGMMWFSLFLVILAVWLGLGLLRRLGQFQPSANTDWTQVSFTLYGGAMTALLLLVQDYRNSDSMALTSLACLAGGALLYLHVNKPWQRLLALSAGVTMAMGIAAGGMWLNAPLQAAWAGPWNTPETERWFDAWRALLVWGWLIFFLLAPGLLKLLAGGQGPRPANERVNDEPAFC